MEHIALHEGSWRWGRQITLITEDFAGMVHLVLETENPTVVYVRGLSVVAFRRREGIATRLMNYAIAWSRHRGYECMELDAEPVDYVVRMYKNLGFEKTGDAHEDGTVPMSLKLQDYGRAD